MEEAASASAGAEPPSSPSAQEAAGYVAELTSELANLARGVRLDFLAYLLDVAQLEAANRARAERPTRRAR